MCQTSRDNIHTSSCFAVIATNEAAVGEGLKPSGLEDVHCIDYGTTLHLKYVVPSKVPLCLPSYICVSSMLPLSVNSYLMVGLLNHSFGRRSLFFECPKHVRIMS